ncbi:MAG: DNA polymerase II [Chitinispirillaceae bacterium]
MTKNNPLSLKCFLLTHSYGDRNGRFEMTLHGRADKSSPVEIHITNFRPLFFVPHDTPQSLTSSAIERKQLPLKAMDGTEVDCLYFTRLSNLRQCAQSLRSNGIMTYESDIHPVERYLMERFVAGSFLVEGTASQTERSITFVNPRIRGTDADIHLSVLSFDIETCTRSGEIYSIAADGQRQVVFMRGKGPAVPDVIYCETEHKLLQCFFEHIHKEDPDILIGWNVIDFDLRMLQMRCEVLSVPFHLGRKGLCRILTPGGISNRYVARIPGRVVMDIPVMLRAYFHTFESYALDFVASAMLGEGKSIDKTGEEKIAEIDRQFREDKPSLARYNLKDAVLTRRIFEKARLLPDAIARSKRSGHLLDRSGASVAAFDYVYLPRLHRKGYVARDRQDIIAPSQPLTGGYVMNSQPGIYENVLVLDFKSLYPTIIKTFMIDPLGYVAASEEESVRGPVGPSFSRTTTILPEVIEELLEARGEAKRTQNAPLSQAIKILMNSFYGVLGSTGCRFFMPDLAQAITGTGQFILKKTRVYLEEHTPYTVIYGDTDSLFLLLGPGHEKEADSIGNGLAKRVNEWLTGELKQRFGVLSALELEFEQHFRYFFMPTIRGSSQGSKKRYCGAIEKDGRLRLSFKGLESARSDWTDLAKEFQHELYMRIFTNKPVEKYISRIVADLRAGVYDSKLIYRKGVRKTLESYVNHVPPHIQAARMLDHVPSRIAYVITVEGPRPVEKISAPLDYDHYIETQLKPIADSILDWRRLDFDTIVSGQMDLFS